MAAVTNDYQLLDAGNMKKLERLGPYLLVRPSLAAVWEPRLPETEWRKADGVYTAIPAKTAASGRSTARCNASLTYSTAACTSTFG